MNYSIIIPAHDAEEQLGACLRSIGDSGLASDHEVLVVDDGSRDGTARIARERGATVIRHAERGGPARARNTGARQAKGEVLVFVDADVVLEPDTLEKIDRFFQESPDFAALVCSYEPRCPMTDTVSRYKHAFTCYYIENHPREITWTLTTTFAIRREAFERSGGFDERLRVCEDNLFGRTLVERGFRIALAHDIPVQHTHRYPLLRFVREQWSRSRALATIQLTTRARGVRERKSNIPKGTMFSILLLPFVLLGLAGSALGLVHWAFFVVPLALFCWVGAGFWCFCRQAFGTAFAARAALFVFPLDCLVSGAGAGMGILDFLGGRRL